MIWSSTPDLSSELEGAVNDLLSQGEAERIYSLQYFSTLIYRRGLEPSPFTTDFLTKCLSLAQEGDEDGDHKLHQFCTLSYKGMRDRRLAVLSGGEMSVVPDFAEVGNVVAILMGCSVPVMLRKEDGEDEFEFVGECYMNGMMSSDALEMRDERRFEERDIVLR